MQAQAEAIAEAKPLSNVNLKGFARPTAAFKMSRLKVEDKTTGRNGPALKIHSLGRFSLSVNGEVLSFSRKAQKKPLDMLRLLLAFGGARVETATLMELLWPDAEGDAAKISFDSNLYRLRKLIGVEDVLRLAEGKLSLDPAKCGTDVWEFEALVAKIESAAADADAQESAAVAKELLRLYTGHFLHQESQETWAISARDKLQAKFARAVTLLGARLEELRQWEQAAALYVRALELDNLADALYRRLMSCYRELGEPAEALNAYRRCRDMLSIVLNIAPSPETEAVRATIN